tara:strand:- start:849 stop:962 length:114 start_codon:yes stop_codon:yes gene_type:complete
MAEKLGAKGMFKLLNQIFEAQTAGRGREGERIENPLA